MSGLGIIESKHKYDLEFLREVMDPKDYFDFPFSMLAFGNSLNHSWLATMEHMAFTRRTKNTMVVMTWLCSNEELMRLIQESKVKRIKFLNYVNKDKSLFKVSSGPKEFYVKGKFDILESIKDKSKKRQTKIKCSMNACDKNYTMSGDVPSKQKIFDLIQEWAEQAQPRHFMVIKGHYLSYVKLFFSLNPSNVFLISFYRKSDGKLFGIAGYEVHKGKAQMTLMKHLMGDNNFSIFFWAKTLEVITNYHSEVKEVFCGSTADQLKLRMGLKSYKSFKIKMEEVK